MTFLEKLDYLMSRTNDSVASLSKKSGIPYTTIDGFYKKGFANTKLSTLLKLCEYFHVTLDYLAKDSITDPNHGLVAGDDRRESELIAIFRSMNEQGQKMLMDTARLYAGNPSVQIDQNESSAV